MTALKPLGSAQREISLRHSLFEEAIALVRNSAVGVLVTAIQVIAGSAWRNFSPPGPFLHSGLRPHFKKGLAVVHLGAETAIFVPMTGAPYLRDLEDVRRGPTLEDLANFHKLSHMLPAIHSSAHHIVEPMDHAISHPHLRITYSSMKHSDKTFMGMTTSPKNAEDVMDMCDILFGEGYIDSHPVVTGNCNGNSPLVWDEVMLGAMRAFCKRNQPVLCSPFVLGGANTPASTAPAVAQLNAEALSALAYTQVVNKGCPAIYGHYLSTVSMKSGAPMAGTPEISLMNFMIGQMARFYGVPPTHWAGQRRLMHRRAMKAPPR